MLQRAGHPVRRLRTSVADEPPPLDATLIVLDPDVMEPEEATAIGEWVRSGGRLVAGGAGDSGWLDEVIDDAPRWEPDGAVDRAPARAGDGDVRRRGGARVRERRLARARRNLPVIGPPDAPLVVTARCGRGQRRAARRHRRRSRTAGSTHADNAMFGLALTGGARRPVAFLETVHGYGVSRGFGGLPTRVKWVLLGLALTTLVALWAAGRRFGPTEDPEDQPPPPRMEYVDALAVRAGRTKPDKEARP